MKVKIPSINVSIGHRQELLMNESMNFSDFKQDLNETQELKGQVHDEPGYFDEVKEWEQELQDVELAKQVLELKGPAKYEPYSKSSRTKKKN